MSNRTAVAASAAAGRSDEAEVLLERAARGESDALLSLYDLFSPTLFALALRITGRHTEAEDVVQDAMTRAWREAGTFDRARGSAVAWLITLTRNRAIDCVRAQKRRDSLPQEATTAENGVAPSPEHVVATSERAAAVRKAMAALNDDQRTVLDLAYFSGLSHSEIAARLDQPLGTVKTRIAQAVRRLRDALASHAPSRPPTPENGR